MNATSHTTRYRPLGSDVTCWHERRDRPEVRAGSILAMHLYNMPRPVAVPNHNRGGAHLPIPAEQPPQCPHLERACRATERSASRRASATYTRRSALTARCNTRHVANVGATLLLFISSAAVAEPAAALERRHNPLQERRAEQHAARAAHPSVACVCNWRP